VTIIIAARFSRIPEGGVGDGGDRGDDGRDVPYQSLIKMYLAEKVREETGR